MLIDTGLRAVEGHLVYLKDHHKVGWEGGGVKAGMQEGMKGEADSLTVSLYL